MVGDFNIVGVTCLSSVAQAAMQGGTIMMVTLCWTEYRGTEDGYNTTEPRVGYLGGRCDVPSYETEAHRSVSPVIFVPSLCFGRSAQPGTTLARMHLV